MAAPDAPAHAAPPRPRLVLTDVDGTLVTKEKLLTDRAREAVHKLRAAGIEFAITSGRPPRGMAMLVEPLAITTPIAAFNGGLYVRPDMTIIDQRVLKRDVVEPVIKIIEEHGLDAWLYRGNDWFVRQRHGTHVDREEWTVKFPPVVVDSYDGKTDDVAKVVGVSDDLEAVARCEQAVRAAFGADRASATRSQPYYLDVTHPEANKGGVVLALAKMLGLHPDEIATVGDSANDVPMFEQGGLSIVMGQANEVVKQAADEVSTSSEDEGFANGIEKFLLHHA